ncbi:hypothetical protein AAG906_037850 [Vitis piasezkii]
MLEERFCKQHTFFASSVSHEINPCFHSLCISFFSVALHLLSEKERNDLAQLINAMVSYSITYKNMKSDPLLSTQLHEAASDGLSLSFDPQLLTLSTSRFESLCNLHGFNYIHCLGFSWGHYALGVAVKQLLMHEVSN